MTDIASDTGKRLKVIVTRRLPSAVEQRLSALYNAHLNHDDHQFDSSELRRALAASDVLLCTLTDRLTREVLLAGPCRARLLANFGVGYNHIDVDAAREARLPVTNTPGVLTGDTADLTMLLMLAISRRASEGERELRAGAWTGWRPTHMLGRRLHGAALGIVGLGRIGQAVARRAHLGFGMHVAYFSRSDAPRALADELALERCATLQTLLARSDVVSLHCPATSETRHLISDAALGFMQPHAFLVNSARGDIVDESALVRALTDGTIAGAALDVFENEPAVSQELLRLPNVVLLPHLGSATEESRTAMGMCALENIAAFVRGQEPPNRVA
jgi:lactate dehydrogenase-like 2-hydroxyacid dehydrogenase